MVNQTTYVQSPTNYQSYAAPPTTQPQTNAWSTGVNNQPQAYTSSDAYATTNYATGGVPQTSYSLPYANQQTQTTNSYAVQNPAAQAPAASYAPTVPNLMVLNISQTDLQWATQLEQKVQTQGYQPTPQEMVAYENIANQLQAMRENVKPLTPTSPLPLMPYTPPATQQPAGPQQNPGTNPAGPGGPTSPGAPPPGGEGKPVTMSEIEWALTLEDRVQNRGYKPTPEEEQKYQDILGRFKNNPNIKMGIMDALTAQSPWIGANVATIKFSKGISGNVSQIIKAAKGGGGSVAAGLKGLGLNALKATGLSAVVSGGFSAVTNAIAVWQGTKTKEQAIVNVASDTVSGAVTGLGATVAGGAAMALAGGLAGWPMMLVVGGASVLGGYLADKLYTKSGAKDWVKGKVSDMVYGKGKPPATATPTQGAAPQTQGPPQQQTYQQPQQTYQQTYQQPQQQFPPTMTSAYGY